MATRESPRKLAAYRRKRRFEATPEPTGAAASLALIRSKRRRRFCVQEHHASHLHYDFRLELGGTLKSWAVPKGPTLDPEVRRLAMQVEDHPIDYLKFEGRIPAGNYGAGEVIVWDLGEYEALSDTAPLKQLEQGHLKFRLYGQKLKGEFVLAHMAPRRGATADNAWLLIKKDDEAAVRGDTAAAHPGSVLREEPKATERLKRWPRPVAPPEEPNGKPTAGAGARRAPMPRKIEPMAAATAPEAFESPEWWFEIKWDGIRALAYVENGRVRLVSRNGRDLTAQYPELAAFAPARKGRYVIDGEIVALDEQGRSSFQRLQQRMNLSAAADVKRAQRLVPVYFYAFDMPYDNGFDIMRMPLSARKERLQALAWSDPWRYADHVVNDGVGLLAQARRRGLEGIMAKRAGSPYQQGRSRDWLKIKLRRQQEAVIVGYTDPQGSRTEFGSLLLALYVPGRDGFEYAGHAGTGFDARTRKLILSQLHATQRAPLLDTAPVRGVGRVHWVRPELVAEIAFAEWTEAGRMRAPVFLGLRQDKAPQECVAETTPVPHG